MEELAVKALDVSQNDIDEITNDLMSLSTQSWDVFDNGDWDVNKKGLDQSQNKADEIAAALPQPQLGDNLEFKEESKNRNDYQEAIRWFSDQIKRSADETRCGHAQTAEQNDQGTSGDLNFKLSMAERRILLERLANDKSYILTPSNTIPVATKGFERTV